jgi:hypothetical protein
MKRIQILLLITVLCFSLSAAQQYQKPSTIKPAPVAKAAGKVDQFLKTVQEASSFAEVHAAFDRAGFTKAELDELKTKIESSPTLRKKIALLQEQAGEAPPQESQKIRNAALTKLKAVESQAAQAQAKANRTLSASIRKGTAVRSGSDLCVAENPAIDAIVGPKIVPGQPFCIEGKGLGSSKGTVDLWTQGRIYRAAIIEWNDCIVWAEFNNIEGILSDRQAMIALETNSGKKASRTAEFEPATEYRLDESDRLVLKASLFGFSRDWTLFDYELINNWTVYSTYVQVHQFQDDGHAEITNHPGGTSAKTVVHGGIQAFHHANVYVFQVVKGPKGLPHHY